MHQERRRQRSDSPSEASRLYLTALAARTNASTMVLADADGLLIAGVGEADHEVLAALGRDAAPAVQETSIEVRGIPLRLFSVGGEAPPVANTTTDLERILVA
ncbi:MAG: hypothetical protein RIT81_44265 [Deltaproteobacteria bacterium]